MIEAEEWRPVSGLPAYYEVSDQGRLRSTRTGEPAVLALSIGPCGFHTNLAQRRAHRADHRDQINAEQRAKRVRTKPSEVPTECGEPRAPRQPHPAGDPPPPGHANHRRAGASLVGRPINLNGAETGGEDAGDAST